MISKIKWKDYKNLGNLELDFRKQDGTIYNTIVLAGENGTGKTTILNSLSGYLNMHSIMPFEYIEYTVESEPFRITPNRVHGEFGFHSRLNLKTGNREEVLSGYSNSPEKIKADTFDLRHYGFSYSKARVGFKSSPVKTSSTLQVDKDKYEPDEDDDFTHIKQLLVDIDTQDSSEWKRVSEAGGLNDVKFNDFKKNSKGYRFEKAFNEFFQSIKYVGINNEDSKEKKVEFKKNNQLISVDDLSTGEKQIVFRGAHLLKNTNNLSGGVVLIDEPELSMHPSWQKKVFDYYRQLFTNSGDQKVQMIIATHSEYVIQSALMDPDNVLVVVLSDENGVINNRNISAPNCLPSITQAETNYLAFGVQSTDYHIELYGYLQSKTGKDRVWDCDQYISQQTNFYNPVIHEKVDSYQGRQYLTLPTYIRNAIDHPDSGRSYTEDEMRISIELLMNLCK